MNRVLQPWWCVALVLIPAGLFAQSVPVETIACTPTSMIYNEDRVDLSWSFAGGAPDSVTIDFDDGSTVSLPGAPTSHRHIYRSAGRYDLTISAWTGGVPTTTVTTDLVIVAQRAIPGTNYMFVHHSTGRNLIRDAGVRSRLEWHAVKGGPRIEFWDHDYHSGNSYTGIILPDSTVYSDWSYGVQANYIQPAGYYAIFTGSAFRDSLLSRHDVIVFKNDHRTGDIVNEDHLAAYQAEYLTIRDILDQYPDKMFVMVSGPPRRPTEITNGEADRARRFYDWLQSPEFMNDHPNIMFFDLFDALANPNDPSDPERNMQRSEYQLPPASSTDSHPNQLANETIGPDFADFLIRIVDPNWISPVAGVTPAALPVLLNHHNAPNPFNPLTWIRYELDTPAEVSLRVFDLSGRLVRTMLAPTRQDAGRHGVPWDGTDASGRHMASGVYLYRITADHEMQAGRMVLAR